MNRVNLTVAVVIAMNSLLVTHPARTDETGPTLRLNERAAAAVRQEPFAA